MKSKSEITGMWYENEDVCFYRNTVQAAWMLSKNCQLVDIFESNGKIVFCFWRKDHNRLIKEWAARKSTE